MLAMNPLPKPAMGMSSGMRLGPYEILSFLGAGGMGEVYQARDTRLERIVAIKVLPSHLSSDPDLKARFQCEARSISGLQHASICVLYDIGNQDGIDFLVMEYLEGETLQVVLERGPLPLGQVLATGIQIANALEKAHLHGIIHRDLKPGNIMLTKAGAKLMDFGLAKMHAFTANQPAARSAIATISSPASPITVMGSVIGTVQYMSPEQIQGKEIDARSDIFSLGAVLYEAVTGQRPFAGATVLEIGANILRDEPIAPSRINLLLPAKLEFVILKALAKQRDQRYQSARELLDDLCAIDELEQTRTAVKQDSVSLPARVGSASKTLSDLSRLLQRPRIPIAYMVMAVIVVASASWLGLRLLRPGRHYPPAEAQHWYDVGTSALRDGAYYQAGKSLEQAIAADDAFLLAHARLAESLVEMDRADKAKDELLRVAAAGRSTLSKLDSLYVEAVTATAQHQFGRAIELYQQIAGLAPESDKTYVLVDLGRAYEKNEDLKKARQAYREAAEQNPQYATAFLHLGILYGREHELDRAVASFDKAETIYQAQGTVEGRAEVAFQRGALFNQLNQLRDAKATLERALTLARADDNKSQEIKTLLQLSSVAVDAGETGRATLYAREAVELAQKTGMENLMSRGLVDLGNAFLVIGQYGEAEKYYVQALDAAQRNKAPRNEARARMSLASLRVQQNNADEAFRYLEPALAFYRQGGYRTETSLGLALLARANQEKGDYATALQANEQLLKLAQEATEQSEIAFSQTEVASALALEERYPEALAHLEQAYGLYKELGVQRGAAYNLQARGNNLLQLGHFAETQHLLDEASALAERPDGYPDLSITVNLTRAEMALIEDHFADARARAEKVLAAAGTKFPQDALGAKRVLALAQSYGGAATAGNKTCMEAVEMAKHLGDPGQLAKMQLALSETMLLAGEADGALKAAIQARIFFAQAGQKASEWRALLMAGLASRRGFDRKESQEYSARAVESLAALEQLWGKDDFGRYLRRPDVQRLRKQLGF
jgi:serine/threonine protein kinase/Tfp pilus assembly protein PilF